MCKSLYSSCMGCSLYFSECLVGRMMCSIEGLLHTQHTVAPCGLCRQNLTDRSWCIHPQNLCSSAWP